MAEVLLDSEKQNTPERGVSSILEQQEKIEDYINSGNLNKLDLLGNNGEINRKFERHRGDFIKQIQFEKHTKETANTFANSGGNEYSLMGSLITTELNDQSQNQNTSIDKKYIEEELAKKR